MKGRATCLVDAASIYPRPLYLLLGCSLTAHLDLGKSGQFLCNVETCHLLEGDLVLRVAPCMRQDGIGLGLLEELLQCVIRTINKPHNETNVRRVQNVRLGENNSREVSEFLVGSSAHLFESQLLQLVLHSHSLIAIPSHTGFYDL